jgi:hypothetical protein
MLSCVVAAMLVQVVIWSFSCDATSPVVEQLAVLEHDAAVWKV